MPIPLPNLDDRRWADLVEEGRALIPLYAPEWTDHNVHDPGITLMELFAWIAEMDIYQLNRIPDIHKRKFLELAAIRPYPPRPARAVLSFRPRDGIDKLLLPSTTELEGADASGQLTTFRTLAPIAIVAAQIEAVQVRDGRGVQDLTDRWRRGEPVAVFGDNPAPGAALYLGLSASLPPNETASLFFRFAGRSGWEERRRLLEEAAERRQACHPARPDCCRRQVREEPSAAITVPAHHGAHTKWEFLASAGGRTEWRPLEPPEQVDDDTRSFTLNGAVVIKIPREMGKAQVGRVERELYYLRCRFANGVYDAAPLARSIWINAVQAEQVAPVSMGWTIAEGVAAGGTPPHSGENAGIEWSFNNRGQIGELRFVTDGGDVPKFTVLGYHPAEPGATGRLALEAVEAGTGTGAPRQALKLPAAPVQESSFGLFTLEEGSWRRWHLRGDLIASSPADLHFVLDASNGMVSFGDGRKGRVPPEGALIFAAYQSTRAEAGNLSAGAIRELSASPHNRALLGNVSSLRGQLAAVTNPVPAEGGAAAETLAHAIGRAIELREARLRAVTLEDHEALAKETPGVALARVTARANLHPSFDCFKAPGIVTVIAVPSLPPGRPSPSPGLRKVVAAYLNRRRVIGTRVEVAGPSYLEIGVRARVQAYTGISKGQLQQKIVESLNGFLDPLKGGPDKQGWPFGRDVYRSEVLQVIDQVPGVDHVLSLELIPDGCGPQCGNVCLRPLWLATAGRHEIEVV